MNAYIGHPSQLYGVEEHRLVGGKGDGQRIFEITNGRGLEMTVSPDRNGDITRLRFNGINMSYMTAAGYVAPAFYDKDNFLANFTAGFLTTCGLENAGSPNEDEGVQYPLHGSIGNIPCERAYWTESEDALEIHTFTRDEIIFGRKFTLTRKISVSLKENTFTVEDTVENTGDFTQGYELLYHMNMGYPLLDEDSVIDIPAEKTTPRDARAAEGIDDWMHMQKPEAQFVEQCYYHHFNGKPGHASIEQPKLGVKLSIDFDSADLDCFTEWKMMGIRDYVLGLEPGNCYPDGRHGMREQGLLKFLAPGEKKTYRLKVTLE